MHITLDGKYLSDLTPFSPNGTLNVFFIKISIKTTKNTTETQKIEAMIILP